VPDRGSGLPPSGLLRRPLIGVAALALGGMVLWGLQKASAGISFDAMVAALRATSPTALLGSLTATFLSFIALLGYDLSGLRYAGARPPWTAALLASFCGFTIGNTVGLGAFSGGAVRYRLYSAAGLSPGQTRTVLCPPLNRSHYADFIEGEGGKPRSPKECPPTGSSPHARHAACRSSAQWPPPPQRARRSASPHSGYWQAETAATSAKTTMMILVIGAGHFSLYCRPDI
jgi:hypothetical protein